MAMNFAVKLALLIAATSAISAIAMPIKNCNNTNTPIWNHTNTNTNTFWGVGYGYGYGHKNNASHVSTTHVVGGSDNWRFGFNYTDWAIKSGPFYLNDTLVFKYDPPNGTTFPHSVYLLPNYRSFENCDLRWARKIGDANAGDGEGLQFVFKRWQPHYFACGERNGLHCKAGLMKFTVWPKIPAWNY
ncbi:blue copper protein 1a-like [Andrographis paniculata]|uniref:blue copper protein 1a-like n=1 Tax=Andrographis paniculata TaxID=175694 RepID=UPI0021E975B0|nr:blue copper protein 1a-like [Andrographis paniculata]